MDNQEILKNAPDNMENYFYSKTKDIDGEYVNNSQMYIRSLNDIREIEELKRERDELLIKLKNAQAKQIIAIAKERKRWAREDLKALAIRDLEQQAKGIEGILNGNEITHDEWISAEYLRDCIVDLKTQAKELV